ncbi:PadR family transcriptional regulator [Stenomitos frigidus]|uniref:PadR family transcriptional regulator n=1 Tax=Stenomitos frigidus ULC18 TaxID=2107698 RepID=A0A2T1ENR4_9CYAN|nr:PadR family transcriptional regulator [Stenomitos frigidus]PSB34343.1 PadR family transcriptional regulator [Stenomitos frigidus ULC18]
MALAHAILALLVDCPKSGYDLTKSFEESVGCFWKATHQQIYRELAKLEAQGWLQSAVVLQDGRPDKKLYTVTDMGQHQLTHWIAEPCDTTPIKEALLVKIFVGSLVPLQVVRQQLTHHRQLHVDQLAHYRQLEATFFQTPESLSLKDKLQYLVLRKGVRYETDWIDWCDEALACLREEGEGLEDGVKTRSDD